MGQNEPNQRLNPANQPPIPPKPVEIGEIVHIRDITKRNTALCGSKSKKIVSAPPDCVVCLDIYEYRRSKEW